MPIIENLGSFYLGREYDPAADTPHVERPIHYDSRDLTTHAVCVGMTGSGKTGLCICLLEEAALDGIPAILIDPKGDLANLLLTFPDLRPEDFLPWINPDEVARKGTTPMAAAAQAAETWRQGLASWEIGADRIRALRTAADFAIYTPGSEAGLPVNVLSGFDAPNLDWDVEAEALRERIQGTVSALLGLAGIEADPVRSREHILLATILETAWRAGQNLDIRALIASVQRPPFRQIGVFDVDTFYPAKDRFGLAMALNSLIASPSFAAWLRGEPLEIGNLLYTAAGKPRHSIFSIAHLNDAERMFFVTLLLEQVNSWMRSQPGTSSLRAILYMDEIFGFFPPVANPPSKRPMLTLLKQARAYGMGLVLATQNPVDLDYKGLANAGTWFIGKLQTERDKARLLEGLHSAQSASTQEGISTDPAVLDRLISSLDRRVFLLHNVNLEAPKLLQSRWCMSYLRGPLTRQQIKQLMTTRKTADAGQLASPAQLAPPTSARGPGSHAPLAGVPSGLPPVVPPGIRQVYLPILTSADQAARAAGSLGGSATPPAARLVYEPALLGAASIRFTDRRLGVDDTRDYALLLPMAAGADAISWQAAERLDLRLSDLSEGPTGPPAGEAFFAAGLPAAAASVRALRTQVVALADHLYRSQAVTLAHNPALGLYARPGENERDFSIRCQQAARERRDAAVDRLRDKYQPQLDRIEGRLTRVQQELTEATADYKSLQREELVARVASVAGALGLWGRKDRRGAASATSRRRMTSEAKAEIAESEADLARLAAQADQLREDMQRDANQLTQQWAGAAAEIQQIKIVPRKTDVNVHAVALAWAPVWEISCQDVRGRSQTVAVPAYEKRDG